MSTFYDKLATNAAKLLTKFGRTLVVKRFSKKYDPVSGLAVDNVEISSECIGVELPAKANASSLAKGDADNYLLDLLRESKIRFLLIASNTLEFDLAVNDVFIFDGFYWHVIGLSAVNPAGKSVIHKVGVIKGGLSSGALGSVPVDNLETIVSNFTEIIGRFAP